MSIPLRQVQAVVELLDEGNTVPFITRYRKDQTGGLDEEQIRHVQGRLEKLRQLAERKQTILRSIEAQGKLTEQLSEEILAATTPKRLEDLYLPFKPRKQTLATQARERGLENLAREILIADPACADLDARAADFANVDRQVHTGADALLGAGHILAEQFSERAELRQRLREILHRTGKLVSTRIGGESKPEGQPESAEFATASQPSRPESPPTPPPDMAVPSHPTGPKSTTASEPEATAENPAPAGPAPPNTRAPEETPKHGELAGAESAEDHSAEGVPAGPEPMGDPAIPGPPHSNPQSVPNPEPDKPRPDRKRARRSKGKQKQTKAERKTQKRKKIEQQQIEAFRDYFDFCEGLRKIPPHRVLAINRGERARVLRVKIDADLDAMHRTIDERLIPEGHPHADYLRGCARDALARLILPALEREARRELTDKAEFHAVSVFAKNLRNLLLQPPIHGRRVLAVDPGFRNGCKLVALDQFGNVLEHGVIYLVGRPERTELGKQKAVDMIRRYGLSVVAIGNGTGCRQTEDFFAGLLAGDLHGDGVSYVIVNEAGASVYSTSRLGREEFPNYDASLRGAISIGRRLLDPLSELVKIDPANIGVGLYQHDVRAKHLRTSLDEVVESCVNYVGVEVNTASPALLRYVSGLNQLTAWRVYEHRLEHGPFRTREQLRNVPGLGEATFVQAAGFLKIAHGHNPLDATWIHPESYEVAAEVLETLGAKVEALTDKESAAALAEQVRQAKLEQRAAELNVGTLLLRDIVAQLVRPGRDPRDDLPKPVFKQGVLKLEDLTPGMELIGTVLNVVDFGCFVDIGLHDSGLVHVSRLADRFVPDPHEVVAVGNVVKTWVLDVDKERRRVSLTMIPPGAARAPRKPPPTDGAGAPADRRASKRRRKPPGGEEGRGAAAPHDRGAGRRGPGKPRAGEGGRGRPRGKPPAARARPAQDRPKPRAKPAPPITDEMKAGKEPMRTFSDLLQFYSQKESEAKPASKAKDGTKEPPKPTPEAQSPETPSPETPSPETPSPEAQSPETPSPEAQSPETPSPESQEPEAAQPPPAELHREEPPEPNPPTDPS